MVKCHNLYVSSDTYMYHMYVINQKLIDCRFKKCVGINRCATYGKLVILVSNKHQKIINFRSEIGDIANDKSHHVVRLGG